ncbi:hypothetical protein LCGC14_1658590 [marine sediment metagenome]|uniref:DUF5681 domain-containing protein n=1 Tax=marine sediment metagenome TaxID=412755 RepID=A0A0F9HUS4_9ZZZZ
MSKTKSKPRTVGADGRTKEGKFVKGNQCSVGNKSKTNEKSKALKQALIEAIDEKDIRAICRGLARKAKKGDVAAAKEIFDRLWGRAKQEVEIGAEDNLKSFIGWLVGRNGDDSQN